MLKNITVVVALMSLVLGGCVVAPQQPVQMNQEVFSSKTTRVGVAMTPLPKVDTQFPGAACLLCLAAASVANSSLTAYTKTLPYEDIPKLKNDIAELVKKKGSEVRIIEEDINVDDLPSYTKEGATIARKDYSAIGKKYNLDKLIVVDVRTLGIYRTYSAYIPTSEPYAVLSGAGYIVNLSDNNYDWYLPVNINKNSDRPWDEAPNFPGLSNAYFQALEMGRDSFLKPFN